MTHSDTAHFDVCIIGSGFGGSVSALRLAEKGYSVVVCEAGSRFATADFPKTSWDLKRFLWAPLLGMRGIQRIDLLRDVLVLSGAGVGGGSLVYANTLYEPLPQFYEDSKWSQITDWTTELAVHFDTAKRMLGATESQTDTPADDALRAVAADMGVAETFHATSVGVYFGDGPGVRAGDPYFGGAGPARVGCHQCGECMTGCRHGAKNTLDQNYLYLAERLGVEVRPDSAVVDLAKEGDSAWLVTTNRPGALKNKNPRTIVAEHVIFAAGSLGTQRLLHKLRASGRLRHLSPRLGELTRTNSEAIVGATAGSSNAGSSKPVDFTRGVAITSSIHPNSETHIEPVRYGRGSNSMGLLATLLVDGGGRVPRQVRFLAKVFAHPIEFVRSLSVRRWSERSVILLVMQSRDNSLKTVSKRTLFGRHRLTSRQGHGEPNPNWIPQANDAARAMAKHLGGQPTGSWNEAVMNVPVTAHIIGGCTMGLGSDEGVVDPYHRVFNYEGLHIIDGSTISANLGVNPSLTITAHAERAISLWPNKGDEDPRPEMLSAYEMVESVRPRSPVVPASAPAAIRW